MRNESNNTESSQAAVEVISNLSEMKTAIQRELEQEAEGFVRIGYLLKRTRDTEMFTEDGYETLYDFAKEEYGLDKSTVSRFMAINDKYSEDGNSPDINSKYKGFGRAKLSEMLTLPVEFAEEIKVQTTRREIQELKKEIRETPEEITSCTGATNVGFAKEEDNFGEDENLLKKAISGLFKTEEYKSKMEKILMLTRKNLPKEELEDKLEEIITKTGYAQAKAKGGIHIFFKTREEGITCMKAGGVKEFYTYSDFMDIFLEVFSPIKGEKWEDVYARQYGEEKPVIKKIEKVPDTIEPQAAEEERQEDQLLGQAYIEDYPEALPDSRKQTDIPKISEQEEIIDFEPQQETELPEPDATELKENIPEPAAENIPEQAAENIPEQAAEEERTCLHCTGKTFKKIVSSNGQFFLVINNSIVLATFDDSTKHASGMMRFNFCPICGKRLEE